MRSLPRFSKTLSLAGSAALLLAVAACGDDDGADPDARPMVDASDIDASEPDAMDNPDAGPAELRAGTIAITDVTVTNPIPDGMGGTATLTGAAVSISWTDLTTVTHPPEMGSGGLGECTIWVYDVGTDEEPERADEGTVTITGAESPIAPCNFQAQLGQYLCLAGGDVAENGSAIVANVDPTNNPGVAALVIADADFSGMDLEGSWVSLSGWDDPTNNGRFPIVGQGSPGAGSIAIYNPAAVSDTVAIAGDAGTPPTYTLIQGAGPTPAAREFLVADDEINVVKTAGGVIPAADVTITSSSDGFTLDDESNQPHALPTETGNAVTFSCGGTNGECGENGGAVVGFAISGFTTDAAVSAQNPTAMPPAETQYATFTCRGEPGVDNFEIPSEIWDIVLGTSPTRIQTQVLRVTADLLSIPATSLVAGHGVVGWTDVPAP